MTRSRSGSISGLVSRLRPFALAMLAMTIGWCGSALGADVIRLSTGEQLTVEIIEVDAQFIRCTHPVLGELRIDTAKVQVVAPKAAGQHAPPPPDVPSEALGPPKPGEAPRPRVPDASEVAKHPSNWRGGVEGGVSGATGNTQTSSLRFGLSAKRQIETMETAINSSIVYATDRGQETASRGEANVQNDWLIKTSPWGFFVRGRAEYDEFQDWDWRLSAYAGPSYAFIRDSKTTLRGRVGAGVAYELGGQHEQAKPEGLIGLDFAHRLTERQDLYLTTDYLPSLSNFPQYRVDVRAGWRVVIDPETRMNLHVGVVDRYDSSPGPDKDRSDIEYFMTIGWQF